MPADKKSDPAWQLERPEPKHGLPAAFSCEHGASNVPCICHYTAAAVTGQPQPHTQADDWYKQAKP